MYFCRKSSRTNTAFLYLLLNLIALTELNVLFLTKYSYEVALIRENHAVVREKRLNSLGKGKQGSATGKLFKINKKRKITI